MEERYQKLQEKLRNIRKARQENREKRQREEEQAQKEELFSNENKIHDFKSNILYPKNKNESKEINHLYAFNNYNNDVSNNNQSYIKGNEQANKSVIQNSPYNHKLEQNISIPNQNEGIRKYSTNTYNYTYSSPYKSNSVFKNNMQDSPLEIQNMPKTSTNLVLERGESQSSIMKSNIENKVKQLDILFKASLKTLELKFTTLKDHISKINEYLDVNSEKDEENTKEAISNIQGITSKYEPIINEFYNNFSINVGNNLTSLKSNFLKLEILNDNLINDNIVECDRIIKTSEMDLPSVKDKFTKNKFNSNKIIDDVKNNIENNGKENKEIIESWDNKNTAFYDEQIEFLNQIKITVETKSVIHKKDCDSFKNSLQRIMKETMDNLEKA